MTQVKLLYNHNLEILLLRIGYIITFAYPCFSVKFKEIYVNFIDLACSFFSEEMREDAFWENNFRLRKVFSWCSIIYQPPVVSGILLKIMGPPTLTVGPEVQLSWLLPLTLEPSA